MWVVMCVTEHRRRDDERRVFRWWWRRRETGRDETRRDWKGKYDSCFDTDQVLGRKEEVRAGSRQVGG
jgi:hypothetical protein